MFWFDFKSEELGLEIKVTLDPKIIPEYQELEGDEFFQDQMAAQIWGAVQGILGWRFMQTKRPEVDGKLLTFPKGGKFH